MRSRLTRSRFASVLGLWVWLGLATGVSAPQLGAQADVARPKATADSKKAEKLRVGIIGASVSSGFVDITDPNAEPRNASFALKRALQKVWPRKRVLIKDATGARGLGMFTKPIVLGTQQIKLIQRRKYDLVIGVDFMFWFGYGPFGRSKQSPERRLALQKKAFELVEQLQCHVLLGDYPDMTDAERRMLPLYMVPQKATLKKLNESLLAWAKKHDRIHVFQLSKFVTEAKSRTLRLPYGKQDLLLKPFSLLQSDKLHANKLGIAVLLYQLGQELPLVLGKEHVLAKTDFTLPSLVEELGIEDDVPEGAIVARAKKAPASKKH